MSRHSRKKTVFTALALSVIFFLGFVFAGCGDEEETTAAAEESSTTPQSVEDHSAELTLPEDVFDDFSVIDAAKQNIDRLDKLQKDGITDDEREEYEKTADNLAKQIPALKEVIDAGKDKGSIDTDKLKEIVDNTPETPAGGQGETPAESAGGSSESESQDMQEPTLPYKGEPIELPTIVFD